jgi:ubiquinone/menaquinone biosynthesis C-methylase UbiE
LLPEIGLKSGMIFVDIGCGDGFFALPAAGMIGVKGKVFAVDANDSAIETLRENAAEKGLSNIVARVGRGEETVFCEACADIVFFGIVLHDFGDPGRVLLNVKRMLKPSGKLANLDWKKEQSPFGPPFEIRFSEAKAVSLIEAAGFRVEKVRDVGQYHYVVTAVP